MRATTSTSTSATHDLQPKRPPGLITTYPKPDLFLVEVYGVTSVLGVFGPAATAHTPIASTLGPGEG